MLGRGDFVPFEVDTDVHNATTNVVFITALMMHSTNARTCKIWDASAHTNTLALKVIGPTACIWPQLPIYMNRTYNNTSNSIGEDYSFNSGSIAGMGLQVTIYTGGQLVQMTAAESIAYGERIMPTDLDDHTGAITGAHDGMISPIDTTDSADPAEIDTSLGMAMEATPETAVIVWSGIGGAQHTLSLNTGTAVDSRGVAMSGADTHPSINWNGIWQVNDYHPEIKVLLD